MGLVSPPQISDGTTIDAADVNTPINVIANEFNGHIDNVNISATAAIDAAKLAGGTTGMFGAQQSWTPSLTNLSGGAVSYSTFIQIGKMVFFRFKYALAGTNVAGAVDVSAPVNYAVSSITFEYLPGTVSLAHSGGPVLDGHMIWVDNTKFRIQVLDTSGAYLIGDNLTSSVPFTWGTGDFIECSGYYEGV